MTFPVDPSTPIADRLGPVPHMVPDELAKRLRSEACREGGEGCHDPLCLCTCHDQDFPGDPSDLTLARVMAGLDEIIRQAPGTWSGFEIIRQATGTSSGFDVPPPYDPRPVVTDRAGDVYRGTGA